MKVSFIDPGRLRTELRLMASVATADGMGGRTEEWVETGSLFAHVEPLRADSRFGAGQTLEEATHRVTLRFRAGLASGMRQWAPICGTQRPNLSVAPTGNGARSLAQTPSDNPAPWRPGRLQPVNSRRRAVNGRAAGYCTGSSTISAREPNAISGVGGGRVSAPAQPHKPISASAPHAFVIASMAYLHEQANQCLGTFDYMCPAQVPQQRSSARYPALNNCCASR